MCCPTSWVAQQLGTADWNSVLVGEGFQYVGMPASQWVSYLCRELPSIYRNHSESVYSKLYKSTPSKTKANVNLCKNMGPQSYFYISISGDSGPGFKSLFCRNARWVVVVGQESWVLF